MIFGKFLKFNIFANFTTKIKIICPKHGVFEQTVNNHLKGSSCPNCCKNKKLTKDSFIEKAKKVHKNKFDYCCFNNLAMILQ